MDFRIVRTGAPTERIDVKTTRGAFDRALHISFSELREMAAEVEGPYRIYRVFDADEPDAKLRISEDLKNFANTVHGALSALPFGTVVDAVSVDPARISFGEAIGLAPPDEGENA
ncbi:MAG: hypothetical protein JO008_20625 [Alphaproteobacteria bacterium]|nr:hypothetical protein [Alphaproteobacteria bacterium]